MAIHERLRVEPRAARPALDAVAGEREGRSRESDDRNAGVESRAGRAHDVHHEADAVDIVQFPHPGHVGRLANGVVDDRPLAGGELQIEPHRFEQGQQVAEDDGGVHAEPLHGGDHHLGRETGRLAELEEPDILADGPVFRQVAARLPHQPDRRPLDRLAPAGPHEERLAEAVASGRLNTGLLHGAEYTTASLVGRSRRLFSAASPGPWRQRGTDYDRRVA